MTIDPSWLTAIAIIALPVLGFALGARWMNYRHRLGASRDGAQEAPTASTTLDALDSVQAQVEELAERQDFAERLMLGRKESRYPGSREAATPV